MPLLQTAMMRDTSAPLLVSPNTIVPLHVEVRLSINSTLKLPIIRDTVSQMLATENGYNIPSDWTGFHADAQLSTCVERVHIAELSSGVLFATTANELAQAERFTVKWLPKNQASLNVHVYQCFKSDDVPEYTNDGEEEVMAATDLVLPSTMWEGLWESLIYPDDIKMRLLDYIYTTIVFSDAGIDQHIVSWNRLVLLHGPPGGGKTSLAHALAQKLSIRLSARYRISRILEINSHSLFSKWFSESGKLVQKLFSHITGILEEDDVFVVVLIDEVESLTAARAGAVAGSEPSDAVRVVNALLTQLDKLKRHKNVLVMATSNLPDAIDTAFVDRADIVQFVDLPPAEAIYMIIRTCALELMNRGLVQPFSIPEMDSSFTHQSQTRSTSDPIEQVARRLFHISQLCRMQNMSGRSLRRLPVLAHAQCVGLMTQPLRKSSQHGPHSAGMKIDQWLDAMEYIVTQKAEQHTHFGGAGRSRATTIEP